MITNYDLGFTHFEDERRYQGLWRAVIIQAFQDAMSNNNKHEFKLLKSSAKSWLKGKSKEFRIVCSHANMEPSEVTARARFLNIIE